MQRTSLTADFRTARLDLTLYIWPRASPLCLRPRSSSCNTPRNWPAACRTCRSAARCRTSSPRRWAERWWWRRRPWTRPRRGPELRSRTAPGKLSAVRQREVRIHNNSYILTPFNQSRFTLPTMQLWHRVTSLEAIWSVQLEVSISDFHCACSEKHGRSLQTGSLQQLIQQSRELKKRHEAPDAISQRLQVSTDELNEHYRSWSVIVLLVYVGELLLRGSHLSSDLEFRLGCTFLCRRFHFKIKHVG